MSLCADFFLVVIWSTSHSLGASFSLGARTRAQQSVLGNDTFPTCHRACDACYLDNRQGCLAFCHRGCQEYCTTRLTFPDCQERSQWSARVAHVFEALDVSARMCQATGIDGCPRPPVPQNDPNVPPPVDPYGIHRRNSTNDSEGHYDPQKPQIELNDTNRGEEYFDPQNPQTEPAAAGHVKIPPAADKETAAKPLANEPPQRGQLRHGTSSLHDELVQSSRSSHRDI